MISRLPVRRSGLTLMELVVVLAILAATAAILVPLFPNLTRRAHKSTESAQISELAKAIQLYQAANVSYPDGWDLMTNSTSATAPTFLPADGGAFGGFATIAPIQAADVSALNKMGITLGHHFAATTGGANFHSTLNPYELATLTGTTLTASGTATNVFYLDTTKFTKGSLATVIAQNTDTNGPPRLIVFGVGPRCSLVGQTVQDAPTATPESKNLTPDNSYARYGAIFMVSGKEVAKTERARFIGCVSLEDDEIETCEEAIVGYYTTAQ